LGAEIAARVDLVGRSDARPTSVQRADRCLHGDVRGGPADQADSGASEASTRSGSRP
jgi:hypothetical protein